MSEDFVYENIVVSDLTLTSDEPPQFFQLLGEGNRELVRIGPDGAVTLGEGVPVDEAAAQFWAAVERLAIDALRG